MKLIQLKYFMSACKCGNFSEAAKNMFVSQPAISQAIRDLEREYNVRLFDRNNNRLFITEDGKWLYDKAEILLQIADEISAELHARSQNKSYVKIGLAPMAGNIYFYSIINRMIKDNFSITPDIHEAGSLVIKHWLENNSVDIGFCLLDCFDSEKISTCKLVDAELKFFVHKTHPFANKTVLDFSDIDGSRICMLREDSYQNIFLKQKIDEAGIKTNVVLYSSQLNSILTMLSYGNCGAFFA